MVIVGGFMDADVRGWFWLGVVLMDIGASFVSTAGGGWRVMPGTSSNGMRCS